MEEHLRLEKRWLNAREDEDIIVEEEDMAEIFKIQQELSKANDKLKRIHRLIHGVHIIGLRNGKTVINDIFQEIDDIIDGKIIKGDEEE